MKSSFSTRGVVQLALSVLTLVYSVSAAAIPLYARQTGMQCAACHTTFPELTPFGRKFKLSGYTLGNQQDVPLAAMLIASANHIGNNKDSNGDKIYGKNDALVFEGGSLFTGGKFGDHVGGFVQWTYSAIDSDDDQHFHGHSELDNADLRATNTFSVGDNTVMGGLTLHNNPTVQDVWNTAPAWSFPYMSPSVAAPGTGPASTFVESGAKVAGIGAYAFINDTFYVEATGYRKANGALSILKSGAAAGDIADLKGLSPYWRLAYNVDAGSHHLMIGHFGTIATLNAAPGATDGDRFRDIGFDSQYQYFSDNDEHIITAHASYIDERADWRSGFAGGANDNPTSHLKSTHFKLGWLYERKYGLNASLFRLTGDIDNARFGTANGSPDTSGYVLELDYLPTIDFAYDKQLTARIGLQYTAYNKFNGASSGYDGTSRKASDNNTTYLYLWTAF
jgi:hypothetical protein